MQLCKRLQNFELAWSGHVSRSDYIVETLVSILGTSESQYMFFHITRGPYSDFARPAWNEWIINHHHRLWAYKPLWSLQHECQIQDHETSTRQRTTSTTQDWQGFLSQSYCWWYHDTCWRLAGRKMWATSRLNAQHVNTCCTRSYIIGNKSNVLTYCSMIRVLYWFP